MTGDRRGGGSVFARPGFRRLWVARTVSQWGDVAQFTTVALLVLHLSGSATGVSGAVLAETVPVIALAPLAGSLVDRLPRVPVMVTADVTRAVLAAALAMWHGRLAVVYAVAFGLSAGAVFFNPAAGSLLPTLVDEDQILAANSGIWSAAVLSQVALAPLAGVLAGTVGYSAAFAANSASFAVSAALLARLRPAEPPLPVSVPSMWSHAAGGLVSVAGDRLLRAVAVSQALAALSAGATSALLVVLVRRHLHASGIGFGLALAAIGVGAFTGPVLLSRWRNRSSHGPIVFAAFGLRGLVDVALATVTALPEALAALAAYGLGTSAGNVSFSSLVQTRVPDRQRGRVFAIFDLLWHAGRLVSIAGGGALADAYGIRAVYYLGGTLLLAAALIGVSATRNTTPTGGAPRPPG